jgi:glutamyl-tRNA synthetase
MPPSSIRVRFAPSPTGYLHVGGLRTALYNYLFARKHGGTFLLRIEDTDRARYVEGAVDNLIDTLHWAGLDFDEGPGKDGGVGPYVQSERLGLYKQHAEELHRSGHAYYCFCTAERLDAMRKEREALKLSPKYDRHCASLTEADVAERIAAGAPHVLRMKVPDGTVVRFHDVIRQEVEFSSDGIDDQVLLKSDGYPTYHLANVVDDHLMGISHVIRGEEWLSSTPKHILLYGYFGWTPPVFAHLPLLLNPDRSKLSKRQGDVAVEDYRAKQFLKEALVNFVALLGWNPGDEREIFLLDDLVKEFSLERVGKSGAIFNQDKLSWLNEQHLRRKSDAELLPVLQAELAASRFQGTAFAPDYLTKVIAAMRERVSFPRDFVEKGAYFFEAPSSYDADMVKKRWKAETPAQMERLVAEFSALGEPSAAEYETALVGAAAALGVGNGALIHAVRLAVSGVSGGPGIYEILAILGKEETIRRIHAAVDRIAAPKAGQ